MFNKILIANRGEIAVRIIKTCQRLGIKTVAVYSDADAGSVAVEMADEAVRIGPPPAAESYLLADKIIEAVKATGAEAIHPGFGFLSENAAFAKRVAKEKIVFIGPNPRAITEMGDKISSKKLAAAAGVNVIPGHIGEIADADEAVTIANGVGYPVMIKASAGGGGKGMRIAWNADEAREGFASARNEAKSSFGDDRIFIEKFIEQPRHIEIQVLGDKHGTVLHLNERECSIQRRNQKVIEEAPSPFLDAKTRKAMGEQAVALAAVVDYDSAGTVEFIVDKERNFYFLEMNTRLQVEHSVTELITGLDLVEQMLLSASGEPLAFKQKDVKRDGWAIEARLYAEDPYRGFLPSIGRLRRYVPPTEKCVGGRTVRVDSGVVEGDEISIYYDPMIAKIISHGPDRATAIETLSGALDELQVEGIQDNGPFLAAVLNQERFQSGDLTTGYIAEEFPDGFDGAVLRDQDQNLVLAVAAYVTAFTARRAAQASGVIAVPTPAVRRTWTVLIDGACIDIDVELEPEGAAIRLPKAKRASALKTDWRPGQRVFRARLDDVFFTLQVRPNGEGWTIERRGARIAVVVAARRESELRASLPEKEPADLAGMVISPMPGLIVSVAAKAGKAVKVGESLLVVEAMKMENILRAERDGVIKTVHVAAGASVAADELLVEFE